MDPQVGVVHQTEDISLHYPFTKQKSIILGNLDIAYARIKQSRSGKPHVTGTVPSLNVAPDEGEAIQDTTQEDTMTDVPEAQINQPLTAVTHVAAPAEKPAETDEAKELLRKQKKKERRLARKAKKAAAAAEEAAKNPVGATQPEQITQEAEPEEEEDPEDEAVSDAADQE